MHLVCTLLIIREEKEPKPKLFGPDIFGWGGGLPPAWMGAKKFGMPLETREIKHFAGISRDLAGPRGPKDQKNLRFRARLKISSENEFLSEPPAAALFLWGN